MPEQPMGAAESGTKKNRPIPMDEAQWGRVKQRARELSVKEGVTVSASEVVRRAVDAYLANR